MRQNAEVTIHQIDHVRIRTDKNFAEVVRSLEAATGVFDEAQMKSRAAAGASPVNATDAINAMAGPSGFMRFAAWDHGTALRLTGRPAVDAVRFVIGNPTIAVRMTSRRISSALYAPLSLLIAGAERGGTYIEYDRPSTLFAQFDDAEIAGVASELDQKLDALIQSIAAS